MKIGWSDWPVLFFNCERKTKILQQTGICGDMWVKYFVHESASSEACCAGILETRDFQSAAPGPHQLNTGYCEVAL